MFILQLENELEVQREMDDTVTLLAIKAGQLIFKDFADACTCNENCAFKNSSKQKNKVSFCRSNDCNKCVKIQSTLTKFVNFVTVNSRRKTYQMTCLLEISVKLYTEVKLCRNQHIRAMLLMRMSEERLAEVVAVGRLISKYEMNELLNVIIAERKHTYFWKGMRNLSARFEMNPSNTVKYLDMKLLSYPKWIPFLKYHLKN